ncbi:prefoldin subunit beta [Candidatus Pacearchaeota archaeon]|nr:prefoldin subunit beta [Candidatus Pacearchaeota archaeon]
MENNNQKLQEMQMLEQNLQNLLMQKQAFHMELSETATALAEVDKADDEIFRIVGQLMIKSNKAKVMEDLENKKKLLELRVETMDRQEKNLNEQAESLREEIMGAMKEQKKE